jgi:hypothetical protein
MTLIVGKDYKFIFKIPHIGNYDNSLIFGYLMPLSTIFSCIVAVSFIGGGNQSTGRKPPTCRKLLTLYHMMLH